MFKKTKNLKFTGYLIITIILTLGFSISLQSLLAAWTTPTASPPNSNVFPLIYNESTTPETKIGISKTELNHNVDNSFYINSYDDLQLRINSDGAGSGDFGVNNSSNTRLLTVMNSGNVGIGITIPTHKLDVDGGFTHMTYNTQSVPASIGGGGLTIGWNRSNGSGEINLYNVYNNPATSFQFSQKTGASTYNDLMVIKGNGNVGIGMTNPSQKLDVAGNITASTFYDRDNTGYYVNPAGTSKFNTINLGGADRNSWPSDYHGLFGACFDDSWNGVSNVHWPGVKSGNSCVCASGYTLVLTGRQASGTITHRWYSCLKN